MPNLTWLGFKKHITMQGKIEQLSYISLLLTIFFLPISTTLTDGFFLLTPLLMLSSGKLQEKMVFIGQNRLTPAFLALFAFMFIGVFYSGAPLHQALATFSKYDKLFLAVLLLPLFQEEKWRERAVNTFLLVMVLIMLLGFLRYFGLFSHLHFKYGSGVDIFKTYIQNSFLISFAAYIALVKIFVVKKQRFWFGLFFAVAALYTLCFSLGRTGYVVFFAALVLFFWQQFRFRGLFLGALAVVVLMFAAFNFSHIFRERVYEVKNNIATYFAKSNSSYETSVGERLEFQKNSLRLVKKHPIFGVGTGNFRYQYVVLEPPPTMQDTNPHNQYLFIAAEHGLIGLLLFLFIFWREWRSSFSLSPHWRYLAQALVVMMAVGCLANSWLIDTTEGHFFCYFSVLIFAALPKSKINEK